MKKIGFFPKELDHGFGQKCEIGPCFYFLQKQPKNVFDNILETENAFKTIKNGMLKKNRYIGIVPKGLVHGFGQKCKIWP